MHACCCVEAHGGGDSWSDVLATTPETPGRSSFEFGGVS